MWVRLPPEALGLAVLRTFPAGLFPFWFSLLLSTGQPCFFFVGFVWFGVVSVRDGSILIGLGFVPRYWIVTGIGVSGLLRMITGVCDCAALMRIRWITRSVILFMMMIHRRIFGRCATGIIL